MKRLLILHEAFRSRSSPIRFCLVGLALSVYHQRERPFSLGPLISYPKGRDNGGRLGNCRRRIELEPQATESSPLTLGELRDMLARHTDNAPIKIVIEDALKRRLTDAPERPL